MFLKLLYLLSLVFCSNPNKDEVEKQLASLEHFFDSLEQVKQYENCEDVPKELFDKLVKEEDEHKKKMDEKSGEKKIQEKKIEEKKIETRDSCTIS